MIDWLPAVPSESRIWGVTPGEFHSVLCLVAQSCLTLCDLMYYSPPGSSVCEILQARILEWVAMPSFRDPSNPGIEPRFPTLQVDSLPSEPPEKPKNTGVGSLFLLQGIFPAQESNPGLPHCWWVLYHLSHQRNPRILECVAYSFPRGSS